ncbi:MAG TPA: NADH-quinone oxidoreductase subunit M [Angustibacter sp.]|nr:NADH-quinone oxidoreductase subunit M [Angustibacter sp.]
MLNLIVLLPLAAALVLGLARGLPDAAARGVWWAVSAVEVVFVAVLWARFETPDAGALAFEQRWTWLPGVRSSWHVGVDGTSLPLIALTVVVFAVCSVHATRTSDRIRSLAALFMFLEATCLGVFVAADLLVFFVWFDLSIVGMYLVINGWGHGDAARSALKFFLYTFLGSLALLLGFIGLFATSSPHTFDMVELTQHPPQASPAVAAWVLGAILLGLAVKTPTFPFHTWLPPAHTDAPTIGSAVLAGVLLKLGTYGFVRIAMPMLPGAWRDWAWVIVAVGIVSVLYGALVALAQQNAKRMIAYTSVNHMGYVVLAVGVAGLVGGSDAEARAVAVSGAVTQMVSHGLITAALFLLVGVLRDRAGTYELGAFGGLATTAPRFAGLFAVTAFASLGLPGFSGFIAELQVFAGSIPVTAVALVALPGILITAALFLMAIQRLLTGPTRGGSVGFRDLHASELWSVVPLLALSVLIGVLPRTLLDVVEPATRAVVHLVGR